MASESLLLRSVSSLFRQVARAYISVKKPVVVVVAGSVGKTSTKLMVAHLLKQEKHVAYMDDSYNNGIGLYLSVFTLKVPTHKSEWPLVVLRVLIKFLQPKPDILVLEYGIDHPGDMDELIKFARPDISLLTAVTPEHMEFLHNLDVVGEEEVKALKGAKQFGVVNITDVEKKYITDVGQPLFTYGDREADAHYTIKKWTNDNALVDFFIDGKELPDIAVAFISEPLIRQLTGAALLAKKLGISAAGIKSGLVSAQPAASRMRVFKGIKGSTIIDDTTNFSPDAGIEALKAVKRLRGTRYIAVLGNMHELGAYEAKGFQDVAEHFKGLDMLVLVGNLAEKYFVPLAKKQGFAKGKNVFLFQDSPSAGEFVKEQLQKDDIVLVKGPFGGYFLEEAVKKLLKDKNDAQYLTRQSKFWLKKKYQKFGNRME